MTLFHAVILGIVEGITEFLPISSTGHLILAGKLLGIPPSDFLTSFEIAIQLGAILAVVALYWRKLFMDLETLKRVIVAFLPTALIGLLLYKFIKNFLFNNSSVVLASLFLGGFFLVLFEKFYQRKGSALKPINNISHKNAFLIGIFQSLAVIPGVSRSAATIVGGLILGAERKAIVEFSFLLAVPTIAAATAFDLLKQGASFSSGQFFYLAVGFMTAFLSAFLSIRIFVNWISHHSFSVFGYYRIAIAAVLWILFRFFI